MSLHLCREEKCRTDQAPTRHRARVLPSLHTCGVATLSPLYRQGNEAHYTWAPSGQVALTVLQKPGCPPPNQLRLAPLRIRFCSWEALLTSPVPPWVSCSTAQRLLGSLREDLATWESGRASELGSPASNPGFEPHWSGGDSLVRISHDCGKHRTD